MLTTVTRRRAASRRGYSGPAGRDGRIDILRGIAIAFLAVEIIVQMLSPSDLLFESTGALSALAFIVAAEGAIVGMVYRPRVAGGLGESMLRLWKTARVCYVSALAVTVGVLALSAVPWIATGPLTSLSGDGASRGSLLAPPPTDAADVVIGYPLDPAVALDVLLLRLGPWPLDIVAVLCALFLVAPAALWALARGRSAPLLLVSLALYAIELFSGLRILPTRAESSLPILGWQVLFVAGMTAGYYRRELVAWFRGATGRIVFFVLAAFSVVITALPWFTESVTTAYPDLLGRLTGTGTGWLFEPSAPGPLRAIVATTLIIVTYGLLTVWWGPLNAVLGWLLAPLGQRTIVSITLLIAAGMVIVSVPAIRDADVPPALVAACVVLAVRGGIALINLRGREAAAQG
ncbi:MAG: hypothetical protein JWM50_1056 [Microbacteriaceae bacterium]|jgi:hypothetical protein|nr:hypothetical protein [Microbacteriaceae bacterium]